jgi:predicted anti-sigma-YlaC factor YlaD
LLFLEDRLERAEEDSPEAERYAARAREMYRRAHDYGLRLLLKRHPDLTAALDSGGDPLKQALGRCTAEDLPGVFWAGMPLAAGINLGKDDVAMIAQVPRAKALVTRALQLSEDYSHAGAHMILGSLFGGVPRMLGGDPERSRKHFDRALELTRRTFLLVHVMYAQTLAVQLQDRALFSKLLNEVLQAKLSIDPQQKLANTAAKRRARRLLDRADELF